MIKIEVEADRDLNPTMIVEFVYLMVKKLEKNKHKKTVTEVDVPAMLELLMKEVGEFIRQYMEDKNSPNLQLELADIANFAFLIFQANRKNNDETSYTI